MAVTTAQRKRYGGNPAGVMQAGLPPIPMTLGYGTLGAAAPPVPPAAVPPFNYAAPTPERFTGTAPTPTPYGDFTAPDPSKVADDPYYQFRLAQGEKARGRSAAARGTLLSGGFLKGLEGFSQGLASEEGQNAYTRALQTYGANRDTNAQNFGQRMSAFQGDLGGFNANTGAALGFGRLGLDAATSQYDRAYGAAKDDRAYQQDLHGYEAQGDMAAQDFARLANEEAQRFAAANRPPPARDPRMPIPMRTFQPRRR